MILREFIANGVIGPLHLGLSKRAVRSILGKAQEASNYGKGRELWKYWDLQIGYYRGVVCFIGVYIVSDSIRLPQSLMSEEQPLTQLVELEDMKRVLLASKLTFEIDDGLTFDDQSCLRVVESNVGIYFVNGKLHSIQISR